SPFVIFLRALLYFLLSIADLLSIMLNGWENTLPKRSMKKRKIPCFFISNVYTSLVKPTLIAKNVEKMGRMSLNGRR
ncbi:MAG: hypothetical protein EB076_09300, partial [Flavobacteriia bacterium]|nr:hypothetical protein [Flavobacteriia bacterium]